MTKIALFATVMVSLLYSCEKNTYKEEKYERISHEDWTKLEVGDTLYFRSSAHVDTFLISDITNSYYETSLENPFEFLIIYYKKINVVTKFDSVYNYLYDITRFPEGSRIVWKKFDEGYSSDYTTDTIMDIGNIKLIEVVVIPERSIDTLSSTDTKTVYYCNRYGVVQYELYNGEIFTIDHNCLQKLTERAE